VFAGDLTKPDAADQLVQKAIDSFGKIDIIVNNAGYTLDAPVHKMTDEHFQAMLDIHTVVPFRIIRAAAPHLREPAKKEREEGREVFRKIVNVSPRRDVRQCRPGQLLSRQGRRRRPDQNGRQGVGQFKINVNAVAFGFIDTRLTQAKVDENTMEKDGEKIQLGIPEQMRQMASMLIPLGRPATPRRQRAACSSCAHPGPTTCTVRRCTSPAGCSGDDRLRAAGWGSRRARPRSPLPIPRRHSPCGGLLP